MARQQQKQRVNLARALATDPAVILCDDATSALDTVIGAAVFDHLRDLARDLSLTPLFISPALPVIRSLRDDIVALSDERVVDKITTGARESTGTVHPCTELLPSSVSEMSIGWFEHTEIKLSDAHQRLSSANAIERNRAILVDG